MTEKICFCKKKKKKSFFKVVPHNNDEGGKPWVFSGILGWHARAPRWDRKKVEGWVWNVHSQKSKSRCQRRTRSKHNSAFLTSNIWLTRLRCKLEKRENYRFKWLDECPKNELLKINRCTMWQQIYNLLFIFDIKLLELLNALEHFTLRIRSALPVLDELPSTLFWGQTWHPRQGR